MKPISHAFVALTSFCISGPVAGSEPEDKAIAKIIQAGGRVDRDETDISRPVVGVSLRGSKVTTTVLKELAVLNDLRVLSVSKLTDDGVHEVGKLQRLQRLIIFDSMVSEAGFNELGRLKQLESLYLANAKITDLGLKTLAQLQQLKILDLSRTLVTDDGLSSLGCLEYLQILNLNDTNITDRGLKYLLQLKQLQWLTLGNTKVTDAGLKYFAGLERFVMLDFRETKVTQEGLDRLRKILPHCEVFGGKATMDTGEVTFRRRRQIPKESKLMLMD